MPVSVIFIYILSKSISTHKVSKLHFINKSLSNKLPVSVIMNQTLETHNQKKAATAKERNSNSLGQVVVVGWRRS